MGWLSSIGHFFKHAVLEDWDYIKGLTSIVGNTLTGVTTGNFDYSSTKANFENMGQEYASAFTGKDYKTQYSNTEKAANAAKAQNAMVAKQQAAAFAQQTLIKTSQDAGASANYSMGGVSGAQSAPTGAMYSAQGPLKGVAPPSHLAAISDPATKAAIAATRGKTRGMLNMAASVSDYQSSGHLAAATSGAPPAASGAMGGETSQLEAAPAGAGMSGSTGAQ